MKAMIRNRHILLMDLPLIAIAAFGSFALRFDWLFLKTHPEFAPFLLLAVLVKPLVFFPFGMYSRYWRYGTATDLVAIAMAVSASSVAMAVLVSVGRETEAFFSQFARAILLIDWLLTLALVGGLRLSVRVIGDVRAVQQKPSGVAGKRTLILGAGEAGVMVAREMRRNPQMGMMPIGFLDDAAEKQGKQIQGVPVMGRLDAIEDVLDAREIDNVVIAMPTADGRIVRDAADACRRSGLKARVVPGVFELLDGHVSVSRLRNVEIADLLRRPQRAAHGGRVDYVTGQSVLITGAGGSIGSELSRQVAYSQPKRLVLLGHGENSIFAIHGRLQELYPNVEIRPVIADIRDEGRMAEVFDRYRPTVVVHAAAHKHVPLMEANPVEAVTNNVLGTHRVLKAAEQAGVQRFVLISTDKAVDPSSVMGATKRLAELLVMSAGARNRVPYVVVRFGNVLGSRGSVVPTLQAQIERGGPVTITDPNITRYFMTIPEAVHLVLEAGGIGTAGDLFVLNMGEPHKVIDLARDLISLLGADPRTVPITITGLRPGEKMEEVLWHPESRVLKTAHEDVLLVQEPDTSVDIDWTNVLAGLEAAVRSRDPQQVRLALELAVPTFTNGQPVTL